MLRLNYFFGLLHFFFIVFDSHNLLGSNDNGLCLTSSVDLDWPIPKHDDSTRILYTRLTRFVTHSFYAGP